MQHITHHRKQQIQFRRLAVAVVPALATVAAASPASAATQLGCGSVVTSSVTLGHDILGCAGSGLVVGASGVTIDLNGHTIGGTGSGAGIDNEAGHDGVRVVDGTIEGFVLGIHLFETRNGRIEGVRAQGNLDGVKISRADRLVIEDVTAAGNLVNGVEISFSRGVVVRDSTSDANGLFGIVDRFSEGTRMIGNVLDGNSATGMVVDGTRDAVVRGNSATVNEGHGVQVASDGARVAGNSAIGNAGVGILADADGVIDGGRNSASGNGEGDCVGVSC